MEKKQSHETINAWCSYDAANSVYNLIITSVLFPIYYKQVTQRAFGSDMISIFGFSFKKHCIVRLYYGSWLCGHHHFNTNAFGYCRHGRLSSNDS